MVMSCDKSQIKKIGFKILFCTYLHMYLFCEMSLNTHVQMFFFCSFCKGETLYTLIHEKKDTFKINKATIIASQVAQVRLHESDMRLLKTKA